MTTPRIPDKGDLSDFLSAGGTLDQLTALVDSAPVFDPTSKPRAPEIIKPRLNARKAILVAATGVDWLIEPWFAMGMLHGLYGDPSLGKSAFMLWIACKLSIGINPFTGAEIEPVASLFILSEDSPEHTVRPRIDLFVGNPDLIHLAETIIAADGSESMPELKKDSGPICDYVIEHVIRLVVLDTQSSFMAGVDRNSEGQVRDSLGFGVQIANKTGACVVGVGHLNKGMGGRAVYHSVMGSAGIVAIARQVGMVIQHPEREDARLIGIAKSNISTKPPVYEWIWPQGEQIKLIGPSSISLEDAFGATTSKRANVEEAIDLLTESLSGGMRLSSEMEGLAKDANISTATLRRAKERLKIRSVKVGNAWYWSLPSGDSKEGSCSSVNGDEHLEIEHVEPESTNQGAQPDSQMSNFLPSPAPDDAGEEVSEWI